MKRFMILALFACLLVSGMPAKSAQAAETLHYRFNGLVAYFNATTYSECGQSTVQVNGHHSRGHYNGGKPAAYSFASVFLYEVNTCTGASTMAFSEVDAAAFHIDRQLNTATLNTTFTAYDWYSGESQHMAIDVTWTSHGHPSSSHNTWTDKYPGIMYNGHGVGTFRDASVSGTIVTETGQTVNVSGAGWLASLHEGGVVISRMQ